MIQSKHRHAVSNSLVAAAVVALAAIDVAALGAMRASQTGFERGVIFLLCAVLSSLAAGFIIAAVVTDRR